MKQSDYRAYKIEKEEQNEKHKREIREKSFKAPFPGVSSSKVSKPSISFIINQITKNHK